jgi:ATP-dependent exoDNAse (exonuclease V) beta subunit
LWLEPLAGCVPVELRERADEVLARDREEGQRLAYVAATRARDLLVVPVIGDVERDSWISSLAPVVHPDPARKRKPAVAPGCPRFGGDSVFRRGPDVDRFPTDSVAPGQHVPRAGTTPVVWWDPHVLVLDRAIGGGMRQRQLLETDASGEHVAAGRAAHAAWQEKRAAALLAGKTPTLEVRAITTAAKTENAGWDPVAIEDTGVDRTDRPAGARFGTLVHAVLATVDPAPGATDGAALAALAESHGRLVGAPREEIDAAIASVTAALGHPLIMRAASAAELRREVPVVLSTDAGMLEGIVDLAFAERGADGTTWTVVDYKTDAELDGDRQRYEMQVRMYALAIANATGCPTRAALLIV